MSGGDHFFRCDGNWPEKIRAQIYASHHTIRDRLDLHAPISRNQPITARQLRDKGLINAHCICKRLLAADVFDGAPHGH